MVIRVPAVTRLAARLLIVLLGGYLAATAVSAALWWAFDSGPLSDDPEMILLDRSTVGALRVYGDHPGLGPRDAARRTVDELEAEGGFDRSVLLLTLPTGSGWVESTQIEAIEDRYGGDIATGS